MPLGEFICAIVTIIGTIGSGILISFFVIKSDLSSGYKTILIALAIIFSARSFIYFPDKTKMNPVIAESVKSDLIKK